MTFSLWRSMAGKEKVSKASVNYRRGDGRRRCGTCDMMNYGTPFIGDCDLVMGVIETDAVCKEWVQRGTARALRNKPYQDHNEPKSKGG